MSDPTDLFTERRLILIASDGLADPELIAGVSDAGIRASSRTRYGALRELLSELPTDTVWLCSETHRAKQTAARLFPNMAWVEDSFLSARSEGEWEGMTWREVRDQHPIACEAYWNAIGRSSAPGGETLTSVRHRASHFLTGVANQDGHGHVVAITHPETIQVIVAHLMGAPLRNILRVDAGPLTSLHLVSGWSGWRITALHP